MQPTPGDVHVNGPLTNISVAFVQSAANFIATKAFPNVSVSKQSDTYFQYDRGEFNRDEMEERAPATESEGGGYNIDSTPTYFAKRYSFHRDIPDEVRANQDAAINVDREATIYVTGKALIRREKLFVARFFTAGIWTFQRTGVASGETGTQFRQWNDGASNPIEDVRAAKRSMMESTGFEPNKMILGRAVYDALLDHPDIIDRLKAGQTPGGPAMANKVLLAALFEVEEILVMNAIENTAKKGQTAAHSFIGGKHALLLYVTPTPGLMTPTAGYSFGWTGFFGAGAEGNRIRSFRMEQLSADRVEIDMCFDQKLVSADLGFFFNTAVA